MKCFIGLPAAPSVIPLIKQIQVKASELDPEARAVPPTNFHVTLTFIGEIDQKVALEVASMVATMTDFSGSTWTIDRSGLFPRPKVAWIGGSPSEKIQLLSREARTILEKMGIPYDRGPFKAHVTILRKSKLQEPVVLKPFEWPIQKAVLFESLLSGGKRIYRPINLEVEK